MSAIDSNRPLTVLNFVDRLENILENDLVELSGDFRKVQNVKGPPIRRWEYT